MRRTLVASVAALAALTLIPLTATANGLPMKFSERPLTLTEGTFAIDGSLRYLKLASIEAGPVTITPDPIISLDVMVQYGIMDDLEVGALAVPLVLSPDADYGNPFLYGRYRFVKSAVELAGQIGITIPVQDGSSFGLDLGLPVLFGLTNTTKLISGVYVNLLFADPDMIPTLRIPLDFAVNFSEQLFLTLRSGLNVPDFDFDFMTVPLGVGLGYTLAANAENPLADLYLTFDFTNFIQGSGDTINADVFAIAIGARVFL